MLHGGGEGIVRRGEGDAAAGPRREADVRKAELSLLRKGDGGLGALLTMVEQAHEVIGLAPLPARVADLGETDVLCFDAEIAEFRKNVPRRRKAVFDLTLDGKPQPPDAKDDFQPRQHEPRTYEDPAANVGAGQKIAAKIRSSQQREPTQLLYKAVVKRATCDGKDNGRRDIEDLLEGRFHETAELSAGTRLVEHFQRSNPVSSFIVGGNDEAGRNSRCARPLIQP